jgi:hypothetical protein
MRLINTPPCGGLTSSKATELAGVELFIIISSSGIIKNQKNSTANDDAV